MLRFVAVILRFDGFTDAVAFLAHTVVAFAVPQRVNYRVLVLCIAG